MLFVDLENFGHEKMEMQNSHWKADEEQSNKVYQLLAQGLWFSPGTRASSDTKTGPIFGLLSPHSIQTIQGFIQPI
jgi:hypothetical protein